MSLSANWEALSAKLTSVLTPRLEPGERLVGVVQATVPQFFSATLYAVGITPSRLLLPPVDRRWEAAGETVAHPRSEIESSSIWGWGGGVADFLSATSDQQIRFTARGRKWRLMVLGGNRFEDALSGPTQRAGLAAFVDFLRSARPTP